MRVGQIFSLKDKKIDSKSAYIVDEHFFCGSSDPIKLFRVLESLKLHVQSHMK